MSHSYSRSAGSGRLNFRARSYWSRIELFPWPRSSRMWMSQPKKRRFFTNSPEVHAWRFCENPCTSRTGSFNSGCGNACGFGR